MKKSTANELGRECIYIALLQLMEQQPYSEITVTDIARRAGVSRMTYYRNYSSKDDILIQHIDELFRSIEGQIIPGRMQYSELWGLFFRQFRQSRLVAAVVKAELAESVFRCFSSHIRYLCQNLLLWDMTDYHNVLLADYQTGALLGLLRCLLGDGHDVSDAQAVAFQLEASAVLQQLVHRG